MKTSFIVPGQPIPKGRPRVTRFGTYTPKRTQQFEASIRRAWEEAGAVRFPDGEPLFLCVYARFPIPKRTPKRDAPGMVGTPYLKDHGDIDNIVKAVGAYFVCKGFVHVLYLRKNRPHRKCDSAADRVVVK